MSAKGMRFGESKYKDVCCEVLIELFSLGKARAHFCDKFNISGQTFDDWVKKYPEFQHAYKIAKQKCERFWIDLGTNHLSYSKDGDRIEKVIYSMNMRNRFGWTEHRKVKVTGIDDAVDFNSQYQKIIAMLANGELAAIEAVNLAKLIEVGVSINEATELEARVKLIEQAQNIGVVDSEFKEEPTGSKDAPKKEVVIKKKVAKKATKKSKSSKKDG